MKLHKHTVKEKLSHLDANSVPKKLPVFFMHRVFNQTDVTVTITDDRRHEAAAVRRKRPILMHGQAANQQTALSARG